MNILAIDFGTKRIGLAWLQEALGVVLPYGRIEYTKREEALEKLIEIVRTENMDKLIFGLPRGPDGEENMNTKRVRTFAEDLGQHVLIPIEFVDESFTTKEAENMGGDASLDEKSAMLILEDYLS